MKTSGNTILITGGGTGIGRGLAEALHARGDKVIVAGRREDALKAVLAANPGMESVALDVTDPDQIRTVAAQLTARHPALNVLINNAGVMAAEDLTSLQPDLTVAELTIQTNFLGLVRMTAALLPHLQRQPSSTVVNVSSGLAFVPLVRTPTYSATKAAVHSYTVSLRRQLEGSAVEVLELIPPAVQTELMPGHATDPTAMPLDDYLAEVMSLLSQQPTPPEVRVKRVAMLRDAEAEGRFDQILDAINPRSSAT
jgi:uncharacterized oxidoreductase